MLTLADGWETAFEVTYLDEDRALHLDGLLGQTDFRWPAPGVWWWDIQVSSVRDLPRLQRCYKQVILCCEEAGVRRPEHLPEQTATADADLAWMVEESNSTMLGHSTVPAVEGDRVRPVMVMSAGRGGIVDHSLSDLSAALAKRLRK